jgi:putative transposase
MLARTFGWAPVVFNDALSARQDAHAAGEKISDTQVQRRVVTLATTTPARQWLGEVAPVALVQACQDARRACRNWFDSLSGKRRGRKVGHPRSGSRKDNRAWIRLTRNGFAITTGGVRVAKVGDVRLVWSRAVPWRRVRAVISQAAAGTTRRLCSRRQTPRYPRAPTMSGSTLVSRAWPSCPPVRSSRTLASCAVGRGRWPGHRSHWQGRRRGRSGAPRRRAGSLSSIARSATPAWTPIHRLAHRIACDNQGIYVQDLAESGLARTRLAKSVADAGWSMLVALLAGEGAGMRPEVGAGQCLVPLEPAVLGVWVQLSQEAPGGQVLDLPAVWHHLRSGSERGQEHPG